jgi:hypothetical protein
MRDQEIRHMLQRVPLFVMAAAVFAFALPQTAAAQYYQERPYYRHGPGPGYYDGGPPRGYYRRIGNVCVTSRGSCAWSPAPIGISCRCHIPGFGKKRGSVE